MLVLVSPMTIGRKVASGFLALFRMHFGKLFFLSLPELSKITKSLLYWMVMPLEVVLEMNKWSGGSTQLNCIAVEANQWVDGKITV